MNSPLRGSRWCTSDTRYAFHQNSPHFQRSLAYRLYLTSPVGASYSALTLDTSVLAVKSVSHHENQHLNLLMAGASHRFGDMKIGLRQL
jgi:hypothetical protein